MVEAVDEGTGCPAIESFEQLESGSPETSTLATPPVPAITRGINP